MSPVAAGKRAGSRRGAKRRPAFQPRLALLALGVTALVVAWGYLVYAAIDFGATARGGESAAWAFLALASLGAVACLFAGLMLIVRLLRELGITSPPPPRDPGPQPPSVAPGGRRAAR
ncbi:hypothetical protein GGQ22_02645 [Nocardioides sp. zg-579]|uniref:Uncharacterized protein n=1 Tax=Nocardioides marmotae TaxID=2663857 RepID=A0A6I3IZ41_9ACTN|nr:hypothetical protein [Nocardioides marmotae]MCR6030337.1 hypothetical protein [Gordonia jinghuaiqii]MTB93971.1 hypothetical protein [Nocardioides marmotae]QKE00285.1 hypothetical protein HPC71_03720 [Nocardioides marmotae]